MCPDTMAGIVVMIVLVMFVVRVFFIKEGDEQMNKPKRYPKPSYDKCNRGHRLVEVYRDRDNAYYWDCPLCINQMRRD